MDSNMKKLLTAPFLFSFATNSLPLFEVYPLKYSSLKSSLVSTWVSKSFFVSAFDLSVSACSSSSVFYGFFISSISSNSSSLKSSYSPSLSTNLVFVGFSSQSGFSLGDVTTCGWSSSDDSPDD